MKQILLKINPVCYDCKNNDYVNSCIKAEFKYIE